MISQRGNLLDRASSSLKEWAHCSKSSQRLPLTLLRHRFSLRTYIRLKVWFSNAIDVIPNSLHLYPAPILHFTSSRIFPHTPKFVSVSVPFVDTRGSSNTSLMYIIILWE